MQKLFTISLIGLISLLFGAVSLAATTPPLTQSKVANKAVVVPLEVARVQAKQHGGAVSRRASRIHLRHHPRPHHKSIRRSRRGEAVVYPGSLRANIQRLARDHGWRQVVWDATADYRWVGVAHLQVSSFPKALGQLLQSYPLQAVFYKGNHILVIKPRTLQ